MDEGDRTRAVTTQLDTLVPKTLAHLVDIFDDADSIDALLTQQPPVPILARIVARLRRSHLAKP